MLINRITGTMQPGIQEWSKGELFPATVVILGSQHIVGKINGKEITRRHGYRNGLNSFCEAHDLVEQEIEAYLRKEEA